MSRDEAFSLLTKYLKNKNLLKHSLAAETTMKAIYVHLTPKNDQHMTDEEKWGIVGLLHDIDYEVAQETNQINKHGRLLFETGEVTVPDDIEQAIRAHNYSMTGTNPITPMDWAITACDQLTGLIVAAALVHPEKKLTLLSIDSILKRFKEKSFAKGANRESILLCESKLGIPLKDFVSITLTAMQTIHAELGL